MKHYCFVISMETQYGAEIERSRIIPHIFKYK
jgi:hypothetical protein